MGSQEDGPEVGEQPFTAEDKIISFSVLWASSLCGELFGSAMGAQEQRDTHDWAQQTLIYGHRNLNFSFKNVNLFYLMCLSACPHVRLCTMYIQCPQRPEECVRPPKRQP